MRLGRSRSGALAAARPGLFHGRPGDHARLGARLSSRAVAGARAQAVSGDGRRGHLRALARALAGARDGLEVSYTDAAGAPRLLYFDTQYNECFALVHPDAHDDSIVLDLPGIARVPVEVRLFSPLDLAASKLARFAGHDQEDIRALARSGLIDADALRLRAEEALADYAGDERRVRTSIRFARDLVRKSYARARRRSTSRAKKLAP